MARTHLLCVLTALGWTASLQAQNPQARIDQARQFPRTPSSVAQPASRSADFPELAAVTTPDDAFGAQMILKEQERPKPFTAFAEAAAFFTNNVALTKRATEEDKFLVMSAGAAFSKRLGKTVALDAGVRSSVYRYEEYRELDFQSLDATLGLAWSPAALRGTELLLRYTFTDLTTAERVREFFKNHAALIGAQKVVALSRAHAVYGGVSAQWSWADPRETGRDEYAAFAGYRAQATRHINADLFYRYGRYVYRDGDGRRDHNQTISASVRYEPLEWLAISLTTFVGINRSNEERFDYEVWNAGVGVQGVVRF